MTKEFDDSVYMSVAQVAEDKFQNIIDKYISNSNLYINKMEEALVEKDHNKIVDAAHPLASSSAALGFVGLAFLARKIEHTALSKEKGKQKEKILQESPELMRESLRRIEKYIKNIAQHNAKEKKQKNVKEKIRVMHIDDDPVICRITKVYLDNSGHFETKSFCCIEDALVSAPFVPDILLLDFMLPDTEGMLSLISLKADPRLSSVPVIFMTGLDEDVVSEKLGYTISGHIKKPCNPTDLTKCIVQTYQKNIKRQEDS